MSACQAGVGTKQHEAAPPLREQQAQILFVLGALHHRPLTKGAYVPGQVFVTSEFNHMVDAAERRGFKGRRQLIGAARRGKATKFAMERMRELCAFFTEQEIALRLARANFEAQWTKTGGGHAAR